ncbi:MAG: helix-turn-helix transcriptional regulator [Candidatus Eremiobacteraeota bacterium]|nr:helix-turn-helix transcriptional regulator [Candidatus Eremiobacteraeota bacterium]
MLKTLASLVPVSSWIFQSVSRFGKLTHPMFGAPPAERPALLEKMSQVEIPKDGPSSCVVRPKIATAPYDDLLALEFWHDGAVWGVLLLCRSGKRFTRAEMAVLEEGIPVAQTAIGRLQTARGEQSAMERESHRLSPSLYVLNADLTIEYACETPRPSKSGFSFPDGHLSPLIKDAVRELTSGWTDDPRTHKSGLSMPLSHLVVRAVPLRGPAGFRIGVFVQHYRGRNTLEWAQGYFALSKREIEILTLILGGRDGKRIAKALNIAESTVDDHVKRMLLKTEARNRTEMVSRVLGWKSAADAAPLAAISSAFL